MARYSLDTCLCIPASESAPNCSRNPDLSGPSFRPPSPLSFLNPHPSPSPAFRMPLRLRASHRRLTLPVWLPNQVPVSSVWAHDHWSPGAIAVQVELHQRPGTLLEGELHRCRMVMRNSGDSPLHNVRMILSHPDVFGPLTNQELQQEPASSLSGRSPLTHSF